MASIRKRGKNSWQIIVSCGYDATGKKRSETKTVKKPSEMTDKQWEKELKKIALEFEKQVETGQYLDGSKLTFAEFIERWLKDYAEKQLEDKTLYRYKEILNTRILPVLGHIKLQKLQPTHLLKFYSNLQEVGIRLDSKYILKENYKEFLEDKGLAINALGETAGLSKNTMIQLRMFRKISACTAKKICEAANLILEQSGVKSQIKINDLFYAVEQDKGLSEKTIKQHHAIIHSALQKAVEWQLILNNPADRVRPPKVPKNEAKHMTEEQVLAMLEALSKEPLKYQVMIHLDLVTGMRRGELMALEWKNIDTEKRIIKVRKAMQYIPKQGQSLKSPKNESSVRDIALPKYIIPLLNEYKVQWNAEKASLGDLWKGDDWVFTQWDGKPMHVDTISSWFPKFLKRHNLEHINFHAIRHTAATLLINQGLNVKALSARLGHANTSTTMNIYAHALQSADKQAADIMDNIISRKRESNIKHA